jgi:hypothetical protein
MEHCQNMFCTLLSVRKTTCFLFFFLILIATTQAQRDTIPAKRVIPKRVITADKPADTAKPRFPVKEIDKNIEINKDIFDDKIGVLLKYPDTLKIGSYFIVVEEYDKGGEWNNTAKTYTKLNGIGRIRFNCPSIFTIWPGIWANAVLKPMKYKVVENLAVREDEISATDAAELGMTAQPGTEIELEMPHVNNKAINLSKYIGDLKIKKTPQGIRVRFTDLTVTVTKAGAKQGTVITGLATYPTKPAIPEVPFSLSIASGFTLQVSAVTFSPLQNPLVTAKLLLPHSLTANMACARAGLNLGEFRMSPACEFYKELHDSNYGVFGVGNTTLGIEGRGYIVDFSTAQAYAPSGKPASWKGVVFKQGESKGSPSGTAISNIGYMQGNYKFNNGIVESNGLTANFQLGSPYSYGTTQPYGYRIDMPIANVNVTGSEVSGGNILQAKVTLPKTAVLQANNSEVVLTDANISIKPSMDLSGYSLVVPGTSIYWGDFIGAGGGDRKSFGVEDMNRQVWLYFSAQQIPAFIPTNASGKKFNTSFNLVSLGIVEANKMQGATFSNFTYLVVNSANVPSPSPPDNVRIPLNNNPIWYRMSRKDTSWLNVVTEGVHCSIKGDIMESPNLKFGDPSKPLYVGITPFEGLTTNPNKDNKKPFSSILLQCVESAVITCDYRSFIKQPVPVNTVLGFREMVFTSTANNAGGKLEIGTDDSLSYWGLKLEPKPGFSSAGLVSVKTGQIILTAAGLSEKRHFDQPFWLTWGEMLANGSMGRLFFDFNSAGQKFDKFNYIHDAVALSPVDPDPTKNGYLRVGGMAFFPFFGGNYLHIKDTYVPGMAADPFNKRNIELSNQTLGGFFPTDLFIGGNWSDGLGIFNFKIKYAASTQNGFLGDGTSALRNLIGGDIGSTLDMNSRGTCIRIGTNLMDQRSISLGPVANISNITRIWGCACIINDGIENLVVGGEMTNAANVSIAARVGSYLSGILQITPALAKLTIDGEAYMSIAASLDALVNGHMQLTMNYAKGYLEGEVAGKFRVAEGSPVLVGSSLQAEGQLNWHLGVDFNELQGMVELKIMSFAGGTGVGAGFYIGQNAPKSRAWVLVGGDPRFALNMSAMPNELTGIYGSFHLSQSVNMFIISGGYEVHVGLGAFVLPAPLPGALAAGVGLPYVVGNVGGRIHGEILGGLVSAGAWFNLQLIGPYPFSFQGSVGLEACVLWVFCGSVDLTVGLNSSDGFYIR